MSKKDPLWSVVEVLPTDYAGYGGEVPEEQKAGDCSSGCRWAAYLEESGDWLVCTKPTSPRFGLLTWEHQAGGSGCFEWGCYVCLKGEADCKCPPDADTEELPSRCSFCGKGRREVDKLLASEAPPGKPGSCICDECIGLCSDVLGGKQLRPDQCAALIAWANELEDEAMARMKAGARLPDGVEPVTPGFEAALSVAQDVRDRLAPEDPPVTWGWSVDSQPDYWEIGDLGEGYPTREAAIAAAKARPGFDWAEELWVSKGSKQRPSVAMHVDGVDIEQSMEDFITDNYGGEYAPGWPEISADAEAVLKQLLCMWANAWLALLPWVAASEPERVEWPRPHVMDAPDGPRCRCGKPSRHESGWCGECGPR